MRLEELQTLLNSFGLPLAYELFPEESDPKPPYLVYMSQERGTDLKADNITHKRRRPIRVELYTVKKNPQLEDDFEDFLDSQEIPFSFEGSMWISSEQLQMTAWTLTIMY